MQTHSFAESYAKDIEPNGNARIALNNAGTPATSIRAARKLVNVSKVESLLGYRTRITIETGRTMTMPDNRWILCEHGNVSGTFPDGNIAKGTF